MQIKRRPLKWNSKKKQVRDAHQYGRLFLKQNKGGLSRKLLKEYEELKKKYPNVK